MKILIRELLEADRDALRDLYVASRSATFGRNPGRRPRLKCLKANTNALAFYESQGWSILREELGPDGPYLLLER